MKVAFRVDASTYIGSGHVQRCLTLAQALREAGHTVLFVSRELPGHLFSMTEERFALAQLPQPKSATNADRLAHSAWLGVSQEQDVEETRLALASAHFVPDGIVVDHYALDAQWETRAQALSRWIFAIDDIADRRHAVHGLLDQNFYPNASERYAGKLSPDSLSLLGPSFALLRGDFLKARSKAKTRQSIRHIFVGYGGVDPTGETEKALFALKLLRDGGASISADVVVGGGNSRASPLRTLCDREGFTFHQNTNEVAQLMVKADLSLGGGGTMTWERASLGLPCLVTILAKNQEEATLAAAGIGLQRTLGWFKDVTPQSIATDIRTLMADENALAAISQRALQTVDGLGASRVAQALALIDAGDYGKHTV